MGVSVVVTFAVRANGAVMAPLLILIFSAVIVRFSIGFGLYNSVGADAIWAAFIATSITSCLLSIGYYVHGGWKSAKPMMMGEAASPRPAVE
jgi:Na+-driven multidrug efflux pump